MTGTRTAFRTCPLCEAGCGLEITLRREEAAGSGPAGAREVVQRIRGDLDDVYSKGFICPKGSTLKHLHEDPDRLRRPVVKRGGEFVEVSWAEAFAAVDAGLRGVVDRHGRDAVALYLGNPSAHSIGAMLYTSGLAKALGTTNVYSASTVDQRPKEVSAGLMFGGFTVPVPDIDRTDFLLMLGANPYASNGSLATAPDWPGRLEAIIARGGEVVVVDPRRTRTAEGATQWLAIRPGTDAFLLAAIVSVLVDEGLAAPGRLVDHVAGYDEAVAAVAAFTPESVAAVTGIDAATIRDLARRLAAAPTAAVYGRMGTTTQAFGSLTSWLIDVVNVVTGNLDRPGGAMFTKAAAGQANTRGTPGVGRGLRINRRQSRVKGLPETLGELPVAALAGEIETPGEGQIRAMLTVAGNPVLSNPVGHRLDRALDTLEFMVSVDIYVNETTRHADVILPVPSALQKPHYDLALLQLALRNVTNWSEPILPLDVGPDGVVQPDEWEVLAKLALIAAGAGPDADVATFDDLVFDNLAKHAAPEVVAAVAAAGRTGPARIVDLMLRTGPYDLTLDDLLANPHGIDLGALEPRLPEVLRTPSGKIELAPPEILGDVSRMHGALAAATEAGERAGDRPFLLIGRRDLRSNNSWMHNVNVLVKGKPRCTVQVHPDDAAALGLVDGAPAVVASRVGEVTVPVELFEGIRPGVVSLPHGWGHGVPGTQMRVAAEHAGVNSNVLTDDEAVDPLTGTSVLNGIPVSLTPA
ncbi:molybdopterin oxidoreductase family protein [Desertimonas flava]|uniref:molybdopterin oxidoreductase family protein n=1 Tax=Desertimonas flava TaxID=2064846 RepID=UPI000E34A5D6|nr:molybdopterin oxidoreductase family protein [Desertimonas flava]